MPPRNGAAGTGVSLWRLVRGQRQCVAQLVGIRPDITDSASAEAAALRSALALVRALTGRPSSLEVLGDNLPILRWAAGNGRLRAAPTHLLADAPLLHSDRHRWPVTWTAVRRHFTGLADELATLGVLTALRTTAQLASGPSLRGWVSPAAGLPRPAGLPWHGSFPIEWVSDPLCPAAAAAA